MSRMAMMVLMACAGGCASAPTPKPQAAQTQDEVPIRTQDDIAHDQASSAAVADPAVCASRPNAPGCPSTRGGKRGPFDNSVQRNPRLIQAR